LQPHAVSRQASIKCTGYNFASQHANCVRYRITSGASDSGVDPQRQKMVVRLASRHGALPGLPKACQMGQGLPRQRLSGGTGEWPHCSSVNKGLCCLQNANCCVSGCCAGHCRPVDTAGHSGRLSPAEIDLLCRSVRQCCIDHVLL